MAMVTIDDIAREAGVSCTTVSNVILGRTNRVSHKTKDNINRIIRERGYVPNMSARALVSRTSKVVALINHLDPKTSGNFMEDPFHTAFIGAIEEALRQGGYYLMLRTVANSEDLLAFLRNWNVDGLFLTGLFEHEELHATIVSTGKPVVLVDSYLSDHHGVVNIGLQDFEGAFLATKFLLEQNHRRIAFAGPPIRFGGVVERRLMGYKAALGEVGIPFDPEIVFEREFSTSGTMQLGAYLAERPDITALFATADIMAAGIMSGLQQSGRKVPDQFSIVGFDDINWCRMTMPMLTTVHQDANRKGEIAADNMMALLEGEPVEERNTILPVRLVIRDSVRALKPEC
jgi:LacI family transcriptional regulator